VPVKNHKISIEKPKGKGPEKKGKKKETEGKT
jgi:hypothetical protein